MNESGINTLAALIDDLDPDLDPASDRKPAAKPTFYAIRKCDALRAPAIFFHWDDCRFYVNVKENDDPVEYQCFDMLAEAARYLSPQPPKKTQPKKKKAAQKAAAETSAKDVKPPARAETPSASTKTVVDSPSPNKTSGIATQKPSGSDATNTAPITCVAALKDPPPSSTLEPALLHQSILNSPTKRMGLPLQRKAVKKAPPVSAKRTVKSVKKPVVKKSVATSAKKTVKSSKATTLKTAPKKKKSTAKVAEVAVVEKLTTRKSVVKWEDKFQLLKEFKEEFGVMDFLSVRRQNYGKYKGLYAWVCMAQ